MSELSFTAFVLSLASSAAIHFGDLADPDSGQKLEPNLEGAALERVRQTHLTLICGMGKWEEGCLEETVALSEWCRRKGIPSTRDIWGRETYHDWPCWKQQVQKHFWGIWG